MVPYLTLTDLELVDLLKKDDSDAFSEIYSRYAVLLVGFATSKLFDLEDSRDIIHDVFVKLWQERKQLKVDRDLRAFLFKLTRYRIVDKIRKNMTRQEYAAMVNLLAVSYGVTIEQEIAAKEMAQIIEASLNKLSPRVKEVYLLSREEPSFSNNMEINYLYKGLFTLTLFTQHTSDLFSSITTVNGPSVISRMENYLSQDNLGAYVSFNKALFKWWDNSTSASFFFASSKSNIENVPTQNGTSTSFSVNNSFKATSNLSFYLNFSQNLPSTSGNVYTYSQSNLTTGARLKLLNNNLIVSSSLYIGSVTKYDIRFTDFDQIIKTDYDYKTLSLGLTYLFGRSKVSGNNKNIPFDEKKRAQ